MNSQGTASSEGHRHPGHEGDPGSKIMVSMVEDEEHPSQRPVSQGGSQTKEADELVSEKEEQYPHGTRLVLIVVALALSVFLSALDIVSLHAD